MEELSHFTSLNKSEDKPSKTLETSSKGQKLPREFQSSTLVCNRPSKSEFNKTRGSINPDKMKAVLKCRYMSQIQITTHKLNKMIHLTIKVSKLRSSTKRTTQRCFTLKDRTLIGHLLSTSTPSKR